jgi:hypothetical protein
LQLARLVYGILKHLNNRRILRTEYISACQKAGRFIEEEEFEWTDPDRGGYGRPWRLHFLQTGLRGCFNDWRVFLATDEKKINGFKNVIEAGGGSVVCIEDSTRSFDNLDSLTHCFYDTRYAAKPEVRHLKSLGINCHKITYITDYIVSGPDKMLV